ncbi:MAG TPA: anaerobic sulfatase maturase [Planctomycetota bacterium]|nr:anaerobic sulfatase maturase [Planctomycetota bacterium]
MNLGLPILSATPAYHVMLKPVGGRCNLDCTYCYYLKSQELYPDIPQHVMSDETIQEFIRHYVKQPVPVITLAWQGGEPTLRGLEFFEKASAFAKRTCSPNQRIEHAFQTNGILLDDDWCKFFRREKMLIGLSVDGPAKVHDHYRVSRGGQPTHSRVMKAFETLKRNGVAFNVLCVLNNVNSEYPEEVYNFLTRELGVEYVQFIPIHEHEPDGSLSPFALKQGQMGRFLNTVFDIWKERDVGRVSVQAFEQHLMARAGIGASLCIHTKRCGRALILEFNGDLYSCDHFVMPQHKLGNIHQVPMTDMVVSGKQDRFADMKELLPEKCEQCKHLKSCYGGCPKHRGTIVNEDGPKLNYFCEDYYSFYEHTYQTLDEIAKKIQKPAPMGGVFAKGRAAAR